MLTPPVHSILTYYFHIQQFGRWSKLTEESPDAKTYTTCVMSSTRCLCQVVSTTLLRDVYI